MKEVDSIELEGIHLYLSNCMSLDMLPKARKLLAQYRDNIDVMYGDCDYFRSCIKYKNSEMLEALLELFKETKIKKDELSINSVYARHQLREVLDDVINQLESNDEMDKLISKYLPFSESSGDEGDENEQDLSGFEEELANLVDYDNGGHVDATGYDDSPCVKVIIGENVPQEVC